MKLTKYFSRFLSDTVNINASRLGYLDSRVASITDALKTAPALDGRVLDTIPQGSWAHKTIIRPPSGLEFDADFLVQISEDTLWNENPRRYANVVSSVLSNHSVYGSMSKQKNRCVCVTYANDCHVDIVPYVVLSSGREVIVNRTDNEFEDTNPLGFSGWIQEKDKLTNGNLRKVIRLLKHLRDHQNVFKLKSVLLTTMVGNIAEGWRTYDPNYYKDVPTTLLHLVEDLDNWLQAQWIKPAIADPSCPQTTFDHRWTDLQYSAFRDKIHTLAPKIRAAYDSETVPESIDRWREVFGLSFPDSAVATTASAGAPSSTPAFSGVGRKRRAPREQYIDELFPTRGTHTVEITCEVSPPRNLNRAQRRALRQRAGHVPKQRNLDFAVTATNVPAPFDVYWKVRNHGVEAEANKSLRGEITKDSGHHRKQESTLYAGHHYVECYVVKDGVCLAQATEPVIIQ